MRSRTIRAAVAGIDHSLVKRMTSTLRRDHVEVGGVAPDLRELVLECADIEIDVAVWAIAEPREVADGVRLLRGRMPDTSVVVVGRELHRPQLGHVLRLGVSGYVRQHDISVALSASVAAVHAGQIAVPRDLRMAVAHEPLTPRERSVIELVQAGLTNREIATRLYLAESTVKSHVSGAFSKLGVSSRKEARALVLEHSTPPT